MSVNPHLRLKVFNRDKYRCVECGRSEDLTIDHVIPKSKGGTDELGNLQTMCKACNLRKGNYHEPSIWQRLLGFATNLDLEGTKSELVQLMAVREGNYRSKIKTELKGELGNEIPQKIKNDLDIRIAEIEPNVKKFIEKLLDDKPLANVGLKNAVEGYGLRSMERDKYLRKVLFLLVNKVEELERRLDWALMSNDQRKAEKDFQDF